MKAIIIITTIISTLSYNAFADFKVDKSEINPLTGVSNIFTVLVYDEISNNGIVTFKERTHIYNSWNKSDSTYEELTQINCKAGTRRNGTLNSNGKSVRYDDWHKVNMKFPDESSVQIYKYVCNTPIKAGNSSIKEDNSKQAEPIHYWKEGDPIE